MSPAQLLSSLDCAMGSLVGRASNSRPKGLDTPNTLRVHSEFIIVKSVGPKFLWTVAAETTSAGDWRIFPSSPVPCLNCGGGDRCYRHLSYRSPTCLTGSGNIHSFSPS
ncbi:hypothetical protein TNCV_2486821 [Trichonephila clavipes]|uniref:Uncharacterized protein n=1 Tax=Trichonephila clavipes TaxID=2585209 RepID=A0A8X7BCK0_TRICX|nr:hypothetical protein TNCV_2486821 [Trichonephila clavipes]